MRKAIKFVLSLILVLTGIKTTGEQVSYAQALDCEFHQPIADSDGPSPGTIPFKSFTRFEASGEHSGEDYLTRPGTPVRAIGNGTVVYIGDWPSWASAPWKNSIWIRHDCGNETLFSQYIHLNEGSTTNQRLVNVGSQVEAGTVIGFVGRIEDSGFGNADHLHLGMTRTDPTSVEGYQDLTNVLWIKPSDLVRQPAVARSDTIRPEISPLAVNVPQAQWEKFLLAEKTRRFLEFFSLSVVLAYPPLFLITQLPNLKKARKNIGAVSASVNFSLATLWPILLVLMLSVWTRAEVMPIKRDFGASMTTTATPEVFLTAAEELGYDPLLLWAFYQVAVPRDASGNPIPEELSGDEGFIFPPYAAAAIPFGETNAAEWGKIDPTTPGPWGRDLAWYAVERRWPLSFYEKWVEKRTVSRTAEAQQRGLTAITAYLNQHTDLPVRLGRYVSPTELYGSSSGAVGRTQILPSYFAVGDLCGASSKDPWNDPLSIADCTTRHLVTRGCWGNWIEVGDVRSAFCGYNPGAWDDASATWYWEVLEQRTLQLQRLSDRYRLAAAPVNDNQRSELSFSMTLEEPRIRVPPPLYIIQILKIVIASQQKGDNHPQTEANYSSEEVLDKMLQSSVETTYRLTRLWTALYFTPEELVHYGIKP